MRVVFDEKLAKLASNDVKSRILGMAKKVATLPPVSSLAVDLYRRWKISISNIGYGVSRQMHMNLAGIAVLISFHLSSLRMLRASCNSFSLFKAVINAPKLTTLDAKNRQIWPKS
jgi:hypothetical protein